MIDIKNVCIVGGGSLGHVLLSVIGGRTQAKMYVLTGHPEKWNKSISSYDTSNWGGTTTVEEISSAPKDIIPKADVVIFCLPGFLNRKWLIDIKPFLKKEALIGGVFSSNGFFFEAMDVLSSDTMLWGFQRVPFIARVKEYGKSAYILGRKTLHKIAVEHASEIDTIAFKNWLENAIGSPVTLLSNYLEASLSNSNPILHPARLYSMFKDTNPSNIGRKTYQESPMFYEEWTKDASELYISMDKELHKICETLDISQNFLPTVLEYYDSVDSLSLTNKLRSIPAFKGIGSPMIKVEGGWKPDLNSRYFTEDFAYGLHYIYELAKKKCVDTPTIDKVYQWGNQLLNAAKRS